MANPFYQTVKEVVDSVAIEQILKGADKYPEPFNPDSWTNEQLIIHNLQELRDAQVYSVAMLDRMQKQKEHIDSLEQHIKDQNRFLKEFEDENEKLKEELKELSLYVSYMEGADSLKDSAMSVDEIIEREKGRTAHGFSF